MDIISLPPIPDGGPSLTEMLRRRRSHREFSGAPLAPSEIALMLWAAHGVTSVDGRRTAPSAGFTDPSILMAVTPQWTGRYRGDSHDVVAVRRRDLRPELSRATGSQQMIASAGLIVSIAARVERTAARYGDRAERYVTLEAGHIAQNVLLAAESAGLWAVPVGAFDDEAAQRVLELEPGVLLRYLVPVGRPS
jgi:SagB-type dehydrogenase family enzyme